MKRIAGTFVLLAGLSGCITFAPPSQGDKKTGDVRPAPPTTAQASYPPPPPPPAPTVWEADPGHFRNATAPEFNTPQPLSPYGQPPPGPPVPVANPGPQPAQLPTPFPAANTPPTAAANTLPVMAGMPVVITPHGDQAPASPPIHPVVFTREEPRQPTGSNTRGDLRNAVASSKPSIPLPPASSLKGSQSPEPKVVRGGAPLMRLVNSKRIRLNFEVNDVGTSGLGSLELWSTQDCKTWQKHKAPTNAKAYVVEVDDEGMYGFTLLARSGIGLSKEPPSAGDQPQVWVVVDLTKPDVQLTEVTPTVTARSQQVGVKWKASDKNLSRQPITLSYADKEEGPWKVIASNIENSGCYNWQVPADAPPRFLIRVEALDLAGNIGHAQSETPVLLDTRVPTVSIVNVEANGR